MIIFGSQMIQFRLRGLEKLQAANAKLLAGISPSKGLAEGVKVATQLLHRYAINITHVRTGTLKRSHIADYASGGVQTFRFGFPIVDKAVGRIFINPAARNPVTRQMPVDYGPKEHRRGGSHAFYKRAVDEHGKFAAGVAIRKIQSGLPKGRGELSVGIRIRT